MAGYTVEITEFAVCNANIRGVYISVYLPADLTVWDLFFSELVCDLHQFSKGRLFE
jgi:hypothetical protein